MEDFDTNRIKIESIDSQSVWNNVENTIYIKEEPIEDVVNINQEVKNEICHSDDQVCKMINMDTLEKIRESFNRSLTKLVASKSDLNSSFMTKDKYLELKNVISEAKNKVTGKTPTDYQRLKRYDIMKVGDCEKLICPVHEENQAIKYYICIEEIFDVIHGTHLAIGHGGRNRMMKELQKKYKNITNETVMLYLNLCEPCQKKNKVSKKPMVSFNTSDQQTSISSVNEMNSRCQVDLIDMQSQQDNKFKFILVYQDHLTKFVQLRALKSKGTEEVAYVLLDIFTIFGVPSILQSDDIGGREFSKKVVEKLCSTWKELKIVHGKPPPGCVDECAHQDIENMLSTWLETNQTSNWSEGLRFVQLMKNQTHHEQINCSPYEAMFGSPIKIGLTTTSWLPKQVVINLRTEEELEHAIINTFQNDNIVEKRKNIDIEMEMENNPDYINNNQKNENMGKKCKMAKDNLASNPIKNEFGSGSES